MGRSVVHAGAARCPRCSLPPRWCVCDALPVVTTRLRVHVLIHRHEHAKPSSTGRLVARAVSGATCHVYQRANRFYPAAGWPDGLVPPGDTLWIAHPSGERGPAADLAAPDRLHLLLLDGTWRQAGEMLRSVEAHGRLVRLPDTDHGPSRSWLREQPAAGALATAEALLGFLRLGGEREAERLLRLHFELHVYATLLSRGKREQAERYLGTSPLLAERPSPIDRLHARRTRG